MPSQPTSEEIAKLKQKLEEMRQRVKDDPAFAKQLLIDAGICNKKGKLKKIYRGGWQV